MKINLAQLYREELTKHNQIKEFIDNGRMITVSTVEVPGETLSKFLDVIEAVQDTLSIETPRKVLEALEALEI